MDIAIAIEELLPAAKYGGCVDGTQESYNALRWEDERKKPTWGELQTAYGVYTAEKPAREKGKIRAAVLARINATDDTAVLARALVILSNNAMNEIRSKVGLPTSTTRQALAAFTAILQSKAAD